MKLKFKLLVVMVLTALPIMSSQAGWMRNEGEFSASTGFGISDGGQFFDRQSTLMRNNCGTSATVPIYAEYGTSYYHTAFVSTALQTYNCGGGTQKGFMDTEVGVRGRFDYMSDHNWEVSAIFPNHLTPAGAIAKPKKFGINVGIYSSNRLDPYESFLTEKELATSSFSYAAGVLHWFGDVPGELWAHATYGRIITTTHWAQEVGGWTFTARLNAKHSLGKERTVLPGNGLVDVHDRFSLISGSMNLTHGLTPTSSVNIGINQGLWGQNIHSSSGISIGYSQSWSN